MKTPEQQIIELEEEIKPCCGLPLKKSQDIYCPFCHGALRCIDTAKTILKLERVRVIRNTKEGRCFICNKKDKFSKQTVCYPCVLKKERARVLKLIDKFWEEGDKIGVNTKKYKDFSETTALRIFDWKKWEKLLAKIKEGI